MRHIGDLGNVMADEIGVVNVDMTDTKAHLTGENSIMGRAIVIHAGEFHACYLDTSTCVLMWVFKDYFRRHSYAGMKTGF